MAKKYVSGGGKTFIDKPEKLEEYLKKGAKGFTTAIAKDTAKRLKRNVSELIYSYKKKKYDRTNELANAIIGPGINGGPPTKNMGNGFTSYVGFDTSKIETFIAPTRSKWGTHVMFDGTDGEEAVNFIIDHFEGEYPDGKTNTGFLVISRRGNVIYERKPVHMIGKTVQEVEEALANVDREVPDFLTVERMISLELAK